MTSLMKKATLTRENGVSNESPFLEVDYKKRLYKYYMK